MYISQDMKEHLDGTLITLMRYYDDPVYIRIYVERLKRLKRLKRNLLTLQPGSNNWDKRVSQIEKLKELAVDMRNNIISAASSQMSALKTKKYPHSSLSTMEIALLHLEKLATENNRTLEVAAQKWAEAKEIANTRYPDMDKSSDSYWGIVTTITKAKLKDLH